MSRPWKELTSLLVVFAVLCLSLPTSPATAGWVSTRATVEGPQARLVSVLEREDVARALEAYGVDRAEAVRRVAGLTDAEAQRALDEWDRLPAAGNGVGVVIAAVLFIFIVLLITDILGFTNVFPFVKKSVR
ncbi:MAG: PA2779 family protein [Deferrisomatales bacterium]|nr:PA2779 family protein [Deferrisomatales bacterium]